MLGPRVHLKGLDLSFNFLTKVGGKLLMRSLENN